MLKPSPFYRRFGPTTLLFSLPRHVVELQKVAHLAQPALLHEPHVIRVFVVALVRGAVGELHGDSEAVAVLWADLSKELERLHTRDRRKPLGRLEEVSLLRRPFRMGERERDGVPDAPRDHLPSLCGARFSA